MGKSSDLHAGVQQFKSHSGHKVFFLHTYYPVATHGPISDTFFYLVCRYLEKKNKTNLGREEGGEDVEFVRRMCFHAHTGNEVSCDVRCCTVALLNV